MSTTVEVVVVDPRGRDAAEREALTALLKLTAKVDRDKPDPAALRELRALLDATPQLGRILCDLAQVNADKVIRTIVGGNTTIQAVTHNAHLMRDGMGYQTAPELERALIDHVVLCWLRLQKVELTYSQVTAESITLERAAYWERRLSAVQARYLRACESLARVWRLSRPGAVQVNVAARQVNVAGGPAGERQSRRGDHTCAAVVEVGGQP